MANNTTLDPGTGGDTIATDDVAGVKYQRVKLMDGTEDSTAVIPGDAANGLDVDVTRSALPTGASTAAKQPALGTAGAASADVITIQGIASGTVVPVSGPLTDAQLRASAVPVDTELPAAAALADAAANPTTPTAGSAGLVWNGATWDRAKGDTTNGAWVNVKAMAALPAGTNNIGDVDVLTLPANASVNQAQVAGTTTDTNSGVKSAGTQRIVIATDQPALTNALKVDGSAVTQPVSNAGTFAVQDSEKIADDAAFTVASTKLMPVGFLADQTSTDSVNEGDIGAARITLDRIQIVTQAPSADTGGLTTYHLVSAASTNATVVKASAGKLHRWYIYNSNAAARKLAFHNASSAPTAGASIFFTLMIPPTSAANDSDEIGIAFSTGIAITTVTGLADNDSVAVAANDLVINLWYI